MDLRLKQPIAAAKAKKKIDSFDPDLVMMDYRLDDMDGAELLGKIKDKKPDVPVIVVTGYSDLRTAINMVRLGAFDYIVKPLIPDEILLNIQQALDPKVSVKTTPKGKKSTYLFSDSDPSKNLKHQIALVAPTDYSVIIYGESGAGKEGVAKMIHEQSPRKDNPFVAMDCGAISRELAGSELFGHEKGAFTGAINQKMGHFEMAEGGTLFLDEVGNLPYEVQTLLLRVLQEKKMHRIGGNKEITTNVRIIVASNERLSEAIARGRFREDLYHRLNEFKIEILPLRKRKEDILFFANAFLHEIGKELGKELRGIEPAVQDVFRNYPWPGNVRELKNVIKRSALLSNNILDIKSLPFEILNHSQISFDSEQPDETEKWENPKHLQAGPVTNHNPEMAHPVVVDFSKPQLKKAAMEAEGEMIMAALNKCNFNRSKAAELLGIDRKTLYNKMKQLKLLDEK